MGRKQPSEGVLLDDGWGQISEKRCYLFFNIHCFIDALQSVEMGDESIIGEGVKVYDQTIDFRILQMILNSKGILL